MNQFFNPNEGTVDRVVRGMVAVGLFFIASQTNGAIQVAASIFGIMMMGTAITGFCGLYRILGVNTCPIQKKNS